MQNIYNALLLCIIYASQQKRVFGCVCVCVCPCVCMCVRVVYLVEIAEFRRWETICCPMQSFFIAPSLFVENWNFHVELSIKVHRVKHIFWGVNIFQNWQCNAHWPILYYIVVRLLLCLAFVRIVEMNLVIVYLLILLALWDLVKFISKYRYGFQYDLASYKCWAL